MAADDVRVLVKKRHRDGGVDVDIDVPPIPHGNESRTRALAHAGERDTYELELTPEPQMTAQSTKLELSRAQLSQIAAKQRIVRIMSRNAATMNRLSPGRYLVRYRVTRTIGGKKVSIPSEWKSIHVG